MKSSPQAPRKETVLVFDDDARFGQILLEELRKDGSRSVLLLGNEKQVVEFCKEDGEPDFILLDRLIAGTPVEDEILKRLHEICPQTSILVYTNMEALSAQQIFRIMASGATRVLNQGEIADLAKTVADATKILRELHSLRKELQEITEGKSWLHQMARRLGQGLCVVDRKHKVWYANKDIQELLGFEKDPHQNFDWIAFHDCYGRTTRLPMEPSTCVMFGDTESGEVESGERCERYPYPLLKGGDERIRLLDNECLQPKCRCPHPREFTNCRLLPVKGKLIWLMKSAAPITDPGGETIGAVETVRDMTETVEGLYDSRHMRGEVTLVERLRPVLHIVQWLGYDRCRVFQASRDGLGFSGVVEIGGTSTEEKIEGFDKLVHAEGIFSSLNRMKKEEMWTPAGGIYRAGDAYYAAPQRLATLLEKEKLNGWVEFPLLDEDENKTQIGIFVADQLHKNREDRKRESKSQSPVEPRARLTEEDVTRLRPIAEYVESLIRVDRQYQKREQHRLLTERLHVYKKEMRGIAQEKIGKTEEEFVTALLETTRDTLEELDAMGLFSFHVRLYDGQETLMKRIWKGVFGEYAWEDLRLSNKISDSVKAFDSKGEIVVRDAAYSACLQDFIEKCGMTEPATAQELRKIKSLGVFPLVFAGRPLGTLCVQASVADFFTSAMERFLTETAFELGSHFGSFRYRQEALREQGKRWSKLYQLWPRFQNLSDHDELLWHFVSAMTLGEYVAFNRVFVLAYNRRTRWLEPVFAHGPENRQDAKELEDSLAKKGLSVDPDETFRQFRKLGMRFPASPIMAAVQPARGQLATGLPDEMIPPTVEGAVQQRVLRQTDFGEHLRAWAQRFDMPECLAFRVQSSQSEQDLIVLCDNLYGGAPSGEPEQVAMAKELIDMLAFSLSRQELQATAEHAMWRALAGRAAHRLANVLPSALDCIEYVKEGAADKDYLLDRAFGKTKYALGIVRELRDFSKGIEFELNDVISVRDLLDHLATEAHERYPKGSPTVRVMTNVTEEVSRGVIRVSLSHLAEEVLSLVENAQKHSGRRDKDLEVRIGADLIVLSNVVDVDVYVRLYVEDNGKGVDPSLAEQIFEPFYSTSGNSSGLGLSVVREIIRRHKGRIECDPTCRTGARFYISLPFYGKEEADG